MRAVDLVVGESYAYNHNPSQPLSHPPSRAVVNEITTSDKMDSAVSFAGKIGQARRSDTAKPFPVVLVLFPEWPTSEHDRPRSNERYVQPIQLIAKWSDAEPVWREAIAAREAERAALAAKESDSLDAGSKLWRALDALGVSRSSARDPYANTISLYLTTDEARKVAAALSATPAFGALLAAEADAVQARVVAASGDGDPADYIGAALSQAIRGASNDVEYASLAGLSWSPDEAGADPYDLLERALLNAVLEVRALRVHVHDFALAGDSENAPSLCRICGASGDA